jgi:ribosomal protein S18 acetylase RimI-like enzyme
VSAPGLRLRRAAPGDAAALAALAARTFRETYAGKLHADDDIARYVEECHTPEATARRLADPGVALVVAEDRGGALAGYAEVRDAEAPAGVADEPGTTAVELGRLYVDAAWFGRGVAAALLDAAVEEARRRGAGVLWLVVWERNDRAKAFYAKHGFRRIGSHPFRVGESWYDDDLMVRPLGPGGGT